MKRTPEQTEETRQSLLGAAMGTFLAKGYSDTRIEDIAAAAGVTRGAFYYHFESKPDIYYALLNERYAPALSILNRLLTDTTTPATRLLTSFFHEYLALLRTNKDFREAHELVTLKSSFVPELEEGRARKIQTQRTMLDWVAGVVRHGQAAGELRKDVDPGAAAVLYCGALSGIVVLELLDPGAALSEEHWQAYSEIVCAWLAAPAKA